MGFSADFLWGAATAAYQVEGAYREDGKGMGIWDALCPGHVLHNDNGNVACDQYHRFREDIAIMKSLGLKAYRFSISWPRVMPGEGTVNRAGLAYYSRLVDALLEAGIEPMVTLFHWNLPMWVHEKGGWGWDGVSEAFRDYARVVTEALSDRVTYWMTLNEPCCFIGLGYMLGLHAPFEGSTASWNDPGKREENQKRLGVLTRNTLLAHGKAVQEIRLHAKKPPKVGLALNGTLYGPRADTPEAVEEARMRTFAGDGNFGDVHWWADPMILGRPTPIQQGFLTEADLRVIHRKLDFFGYNSYHLSNFGDDTGTNPEVRPGMPRTAMGWPITPEALRWASRFFYDRYNLPILITENGMANCDFVMHDGHVHDPQRTEYIRGYLAGLKKTADEGVPVIGYLYWSLLDNFEWAFGYDKRFGLVYVDYQTQKRTVKDSAWEYAAIVAANGESL